MSDDTTQLADRAIAVARVFRGIASDLFDRAQALRNEGSISPDDFNLVAQRCVSLNAFALAIDNEAFIAIAATAAAQFSLIEDKTKELEKVRNQILMAKAVIGIITKIVSAAGAVAGAIVTPATIPAAAAAIVDATLAIVDAAKGGWKNDPQNPESPGSAQTPIS